MQVASELAETLARSSRCASITRALEPRALCSEHTAMKHIVMQSQPRFLCEAEVAHCCVALVSQVLA